MDARTNSVCSEAYHRGVRHVLIVTLALNVLVVVGKMIAGLLAGSLSVVSDAIHSSVDSLNNIVGLVVMKYATAEPDEGHPYGHAKFETLAAFAIAGFLFVTCYQISLSAIKRIIAHEEPAPEITALTIGVMVGCSVLAGLFLIRLGYVWLDPIISLGVAVVIAWSGYQIFRTTVPILVD